MKLGQLLKFQLEIIKSYKIQQEISDYFNTLSDFLFLAVRNKTTHCIKTCTSHFNEESVVEIHEQTRQLTFLFRTVWPVVVIDVIVVLLVTFWLACVVAAGYPKDTQGAYNIQKETKLCFNDRPSKQYYGDGLCLVSNGWINKLKFATSSNRWRMRFILVP